MLEFVVCGVRCRLSLLFPALLTILFLCQPNGPALSCILASLVHELGHLLAMLLVRAKPEDCTLGVFGARIRMAHCRVSYIQNLFISFAGPVCNGLAAALLYWCGRTVPSMAHLALALLNLLPSPALDGGQILRCALYLMGLGAIAERVLKMLSIVVLALLIFIGLVFLFQGDGNASLLIVCGYLAMLTFFSEKIQKTS